MELDRRSLIVAAHPDDETIGAGVWMARHRDPTQITILHVTDGAPRAYPDPEQYARTRRQELLAAVSLASIRPEQCLRLGYVDQEACLHLPELVERLHGLLAQLRPELVLTHPYEGGHPDHDAAAFAVARATRGNYHEFTSYHRVRTGQDSSIQGGEFLPGATPQYTAHITPAERGLKQRMFACFPTQQDILNIFPLEYEKFRPAPVYDFTEPPHAGELQYENWGMMAGENWRRHAAEAIQKLQSLETAV